MRNRAPSVEVNVEVLKQRRRCGSRKSPTAQQFMWFSFGCNRAGKQPSRTNELAAVLDTVSALRGAEVLLRVGDSGGRFDFASNS